MPDTTASDDFVTIAPHPSRRGHFLVEAQLWVPRSRDEVFPFFADAYNLQELTPPFLDFQLATPRPIDMRDGALIDYRIKLRGIPLKWRTQITRWDPPFAFEDTQLSGPYRTWEHTHTFEPAERDGVMGTLCGDRVTYRPPFGRLANWLVVERDVKRIFAYRQTRMGELFGAPDRRAA